MAQATPDQDQALYDAMAQVGVELFPNAPEVAAAVCGQAWDGRRLFSIAADVDAANDGMDYDQSQRFVVSSIYIYCPPDNVYT